MNQTQGTKIFFGIVALLALAGLGFLLFSGGGESVPDSLYRGGQSSSTGSTTTTPSQPAVQAETIGTSVAGQAITAYTYGDGTTRLLFVGAIHGGYEYNAALLSYRLMDYLRANPGVIPENISVTVIPQLNPDGVTSALGTTGRFSRADVPAADNFGGAERFNANGVDLNRNFACNWQPTSQWRGQEVSAGTSAFSEPETRALRDYVEKIQPAAGVFFHSAAGAVYGAACDGSIGPSTNQLVDTYANAAGYRAVDLFTAYPVTGDVEGWMTTLDIPAVSVELSNHTDVEWEKNLAGIQAVLKAYGQ